MGQRPLESLLVAGSALGTYLSLEVKKKHIKNHAGLLGRPPCLYLNPSTKNLSSYCLLTPRAKVKNNFCKQPWSLFKNSCIDITVAVAFPRKFHINSFKAQETPLSSGPVLVLSHTHGSWGRRVRTRSHSHYTSTKPSVLRGYHAASST